MAGKREPQARHARRPRAKKNKSTSVNIAQPKRGGKNLLGIPQLSLRSQAARDQALHVLAAMRRDAKLSLTRAAKLQGIKSETVTKYFSSALNKSRGRFQASKSDRFADVLYVPDAYGNSVAVHTNSSKQRKALSNYLRDLGRYLRGDRNALARWHGKKIAGVPLVTAGRTIVAIEPALSEFSLYRAFNGGAA